MHCFHWTGKLCSWCTMSLGYYTPGYLKGMLIRGLVVFPCRCLSIHCRSQNKELYKIPLRPPASCCWDWGEKENIRRITQHYNMFIH
uniref:Uncharacterized protein n=1 Tax=Dicentrarchus labrax TaxID=13489 RepID=A0A8C4IMX4_DICLA